MTSERKRQANRVNAQASTGPKTAKGKKRSALNARRHGLNTSVLQDPFWGPLAQKDLEGLAQRFAGSSRSPAVLAHARRAAEAHLDLQRVRACHDHFVERTLADPNFVGRRGRGAKAADVNPLAPVGAKRPNRLIPGAGFRPYSVQSRWKAHKSSRPSFAIWCAT